MNYILTETRERIAYLVLNRPEKRNALNAELVESLKEELLKLQNDESVRAVILKSSGNVFCAGADLSYLQDLQKFTRAENLNDSKNLAELFQLIYSFHKPVISIVKGPAIAGGCGLATVCDMCFASPEASFGYTESRIGFIPAIVMVYLRKKVNETIGKKILFTGELFDASTAYQYGLITEILDEKEIDMMVHEKIKKLISNSSGNSIRMIKQMYSELDRFNLEESINYACRMNAETRETEDCKKGISSFLNKIKPNW